MVQEKLKVMNKERESMANMSISVPTWTGKSGSIPFEKKYANETFSASQSGYCTLISF